MKCGSAILVLVGLAVLAGAHSAEVSESEAWLHRDYRRALIGEVGNGSWSQVTTPCQPGVLGSAAACFNSGIGALNNTDYHWGDPMIAYPTDGTPWGLHITGPYPDGTTYLISWMSGDSIVAPYSNLSTLVTDTSAFEALVTLSNERNGTSAGTPYLCTKPACRVYDAPIAFKGSVITYTRLYPTTNANYSYRSPFINHVVVKGLYPSTRYYYSVSTNGKKSDERTFRTLPPVRSARGAIPDRTYPLRIGLLGDIGQTNNSTQTRNHIMANKPRVILYTADYTYADTYGAQSPDAEGSGTGTNQQRWDSFMKLWEPLFDSVPMTPCAGNHEIEGSNIAAVINSTTTSFSFPTNYPFQSYSSRFPVPGVTGNWGDITQNLYYATVLGPVKLITLNNYVPFHVGTPQYIWAVGEFAKVDRRVTPWLIVAFHAPPYHSYYVHYKEQDCFMSIYEDIFFNAGVDVVLNGHVHAYERTHPMYKYKPDNCGPIYLTVGDGGNVEGPYRNFVDEVNPNTNKTFCEALVTSSKTPNDLYTAGTIGSWGPSYQRAPQLSTCNTLSFQPADRPGQKVLLPLNTTANAASANPVGFCQDRQPIWSAHRDPSFGHAILDLISDSVAQLKWYRNIDGIAEVRDSVTLERQTACANKL